MHNDLQEILIDESRLRARIEQLGLEISADYKGRCLTLVGVLKGCVLFLSDLLKNITIDTNMDFIMLSSYSGLTMSYMLKNLKTRCPRSLEICTMLDKPSCRKVKVPIKYSGFAIPNKFVVGYGLDYNELYRNLPYIGVLKKSVIKGS
jgi:hypoxanthine phosphoribosyltransferase